MIRVSSLTKNYGSRRAIDDLNFSAEKGEILGFLGPNGAGKTTTMRILSGYMPPSSGSATIGGFDLIEKSLEVRRIVGYLPENVPLYNDMSVFEYLKYMADLRHIKNGKARVFETLDMVELADRANGYVGKLSKGMRQRLGLAQALLHKPDVLILDEPTIGLDPKQVAHFRELIRSIGHERTVLLSTHILSEVQQICNRVIIINKGKIIAEDSPEQLQARMRGAQRVSVRVRGDANELIARVAEISGVIHTSRLADDCFEFETEPALDVRPEVARLIVQSGYDLLEFKPVTISLEEIFLQLTQEEQSRNGQAIAGQPDEEIEVEAENQ